MLVVSWSGDRTRRVSAAVAASGVVVLVIDVNGYFRSARSARRGKGAGAYFPASASTMPLVV